MSNKEVERFKISDKKYIESSIEKQTEIIKSSPKLYRYFRFFECKMGWYPLIKELSQKLEELIEKLYGTEEGPYLKNVRERFGVLCFEISFITDEMGNLIEEYELLSSKTCEICGEKGKLQLIRNKYLTRCKNH